MNRLGRSHWALTFGSRGRVWQVAAADASLIFQPAAGVVVEYVEGVSLLQHAKRRGGLPESEARWLLQQTVLALDYAHRRGVPSLGLQPEHTLLALRGEQQPLVKLRDFGLRPPRQALHSYSVEPAASNLSCAPGVVGMGDVRAGGGQMLGA